MSFTGPSASLTATMLHTLLEDIVSVPNRSILNSDVEEEFSLHLGEDPDSVGLANSLLHFLSDDELSVDAGEGGESLKHDSDSGRYAMQGRLLCSHILLIAKIYSSSSKSGCWDGIP
jgi:hypothetical protein